MFNGLNWIVAGILACGLTCMMAGTTVLVLVLFHNRRYRKLREQNKAWSQWQPKSPTSSKRDT
jgi:hypothetical protein